MWVLLQIGISLFLVGFGQSSWIPSLAIAAATLGYACFWHAMLENFTRFRDMFWLSVGWFVAVQAIQLSWFTSTEYMGPLILIVYSCLIFLIGLQFGCLAFFFKPMEKTKISLLNCFAMSGCWVILEWMRIFFFTGFTWNPVGLALADSSYAIQFASIFGVYGLSFWVIFTNAFGLYALYRIIPNAFGIKLWKKGFAWCGIAALPYAFGFGQEIWVRNYVPLERNYSVALVQTAILPEQKDRFLEKKDAFIPPLSQWERIWQGLGSAGSLDLIVLPESAVAMGANIPFYPIEIVKNVWESYFGKRSLIHFPPLVPPFAEIGEYRGELVMKVTNAFIVQAMANYFRSSIIIGFDDEDWDRKYNAAFCFNPRNAKIERYEKRVLVPVGEYVPFSGIPWVADALSSQFGIGDSFDVGSEVKLFSASMPIGVSICLEETYSHLIRDLRLKGARLFVNISNDVWFPHSRLPEQHFQHGRMRSAENGICLLRACNTGVTGAVDCCGRVIRVLPLSEDKAEVLYLSLPLRSFQTLYTLWGDSAILGLSALFLLLAIVPNWIQNRGRK